MSRPNQVLIMNTGSIGATTYANPAAVPAGVLAAFNDQGVGQAMNAAISGKFQLVLGTANGPVVTSLLDFSKMSVVEQATRAETKSAITLSSFPAGPSAAGSIYGINVINLRNSVEPFERKAVEITATASESVDSIIGRLVKQMIAQQSSNGFYTAKSNRDFSLTITGTSGTALISIDGSTYLATFDTNVATTAANFVSDHAAAILSNHDLVVTNPSGAEINFVAGSVSGHADADIANVTGDLAGTETVNTAASTITLTALDSEDNLRVAFQEYLAENTPTSVVVPKVIGIGLGAQVLELEKKAFGSTGHYYQDSGILGRLPEPTTFADVAETYTLYTILHENSMDLAVNRSFQYQEIIVGLASAVTGDLGTFFGV